MNPIYIVLSMFSVLFILFLINPYIQRRENERSELERSYYDLIKAHYKSNSKSISEEISTIAKKLFKITTEEEIIDKVNSDIKMMGL